MQLSKNQLLANRFLVQELLGRGGMAEVYLVRDQSLGSDVALKLLLPQFQANSLVRRRFAQEVLAARKLQHPNLVRVYELFEEPDHIFFTLEYVPGFDLKRVILQRGALPVEQLVDLARPLTKALAEVHVNGLVHRDIKSANVLLSSEGRVVLADFGLARTAELAGLTGGSRLFGTPEYTAPEVLCGGVADARSDLFSLGMVLFEMATGRLPKRPAGLYESIRHQVESAPPKVRAHRPEVPEWLDQVIARALSPDPEDRFQTASELEDALQRSTQLPAVRQPEKFQSQPRRTCPSCEEQLLPFLEFCGGCGWEALSLQGNGPQNWVLYLLGPLPRRPYNQVGPESSDPLNFHEKITTMRLLKDLTGIEYYRPEQMDSRLRNLPTVLFENLSRTTAETIKQRFARQGLELRYARKWSPARITLTPYQGPMAFLLGIVALSLVASVIVPGVAVWQPLLVSVIGVGLAGAIHSTRGKPLARLLHRNSGPILKGFLSEKSREILPRLKGRRVRKLVQNVLSRALVLLDRLGQKGFLQGNPAAGELESMVDRALDVGWTIQQLEQGRSELSALDLITALQRVEAELEVARQPPEIEELIREQQSLEHGLEALRESEEALARQYGVLIRIAAQLGAGLARLDSVDARLASSHLKLPQMLKELDRELESSRSSSSRKE